MIYLIETKRETPKQIVSNLFVDNYEKWMRQQLLDSFRAMPYTYPVEVQRPTYNVVYDTQTVIFFPY